MSWLSRLGRAIRPGRIDEELDEELRFHLEARADDLATRGLSHEEAAVEARRRLGSPLRHREVSREVKLLARIEALLSDIRFGLRMLRRDGRLSLAVVASLSLAMGACTAAFSLLNALLLRPLPVRHPEELIYLAYTGERPEGSFDSSGFSYPLFERLRDAGRPLVRLFGMSYQGPSPVTFDGAGGEREWVQAQWISGDAFEALGLRPVHGRLFTAEDDLEPGQHPVAVLNFDFWQRRFGGDPAVLGRWLTIRDRPHQIMGILNRGFTGAEPGVRTDVWFPNMMWGEEALRSRGWQWFRVWGRLEPGAAPGQVAAKLKAVFADFRREVSARFPKDEPRERIERWVHTPLAVLSAANGPSELRTRFQGPLLVVSAVAFLVLLIAGSNVANLMLARAAARQREMALRLAIGADRARLVQQMLVESGVLALGSCALGALLSTGMAQAIVHLLSSPRDPVWLDLHPDPRVLAFLGLLASLATILFGLAPAVRASGASPARALHTHDHRHAAPRGLLRPLLAFQVGFSFLVLFVGGLLVLSFHRLSRVDPGFASENLLIIRLETSLEDQGPAATSRWWQVLEHVRRLPGVESASHSAWELFRGSGWAASVRVPGRAVDPFEPFYLEVSPGFVEAMRIPLLEGRDFDLRDAELVPRRAVIVNEAFAVRYYPGESALGRTFFRVESKDEVVPQEIVGVARSARYRSLREPAPPTVYLPHRPDRHGAMQVRSRRDLAALAAELPGQIRSADPAFRVESVVPQSTVIANTTRQERLLALLSAFFGTVALALVAVGLFGVMAYDVVRRTKEIGIRMALGAPRSSVFRLVVGDIALVVLLGLSFGVLAGLVAARPLTSLLFEIRSSDVTSLGLPLVGLLFASVLSILPAAHRSVRVDPMTALRCE